MKWSDIPLKPKPRVLRQFAIAWLVFFLCLAAQQYFRHHRHGPGLALAAVAIVVAGVGLAKPSAIRWIFIAAFVLAFPVGWVVSQILLAFMFFVILTPIALLLRWRGRDPLQRRPAPKSLTVWQPKDPDPDPRRYLRQY